MNCYLQYLPNNYFSSMFCEFNKSLDKDSPHKLSCKQCSD